MGTTVKSLKTIFDEWWGEDNGPNERALETYGFDLRVIVSRNIPPRHQTFSWIRGMGTTKFDEIFQCNLYTLPKEWMFGFPERHISVQEQYGLLTAMVALNDKLKRPMQRLDILTQSAPIISDSVKGSVRMIAFPEGKMTYAQDYM